MPREAAVAILLLLLFVLKNAKLRIYVYAASGGRKHPFETSLRFR